MLSESETIRALTDAVLEAARLTASGVRERLLKIAARTLEDQAATIAALQDQLARCREGKP